MPSPPHGSTHLNASEDRLERLLAAGTLLTSELSLEGVVQQTVNTAAEIIGARYAAIGVLAPDGRLLESFTTYGITPEQRARIGAPPRGHGILGLVIREARVIRLPDLTRHPDSYGFPPHHPPMHSFLGAPISGRRGVLDRKSTRLNSSHVRISYAVFCLKKKKNNISTIFNKKTRRNKNRE